MLNKNLKIIIPISIFIVSLGGYSILNKEYITLVTNNNKQIVSTFKSTVKDLLDENNIRYDNDDKIIPSLNSKLNDKMTIKIIDITTKTEKEYVDVPYDTQIIEDKNLEKGKIQIDIEGQNGKKELLYKTVYNDGKLVEKKLSKEIMLKEPINKIVKKGTKEEVIVASRGSNSRRMVVEATAYSGDGITSTGTRPKWGTIAVDPKIIPYGSKVYIPKFNMAFIAEDCGGAIKGNMIDIFMNSDKEAYKWGRRNIEIHITN